MKTASVAEIKKELQHKTASELIELNLRLAKFKKENKELLTYLLFEAHNEDAYLQNVKDYITLEFKHINTSSFFYIKKSVRKILRNLKKYSRYSQQTETEVALLLHFCNTLKQFKPDISQNVSLSNIYQRQLALAKKLTTTLHPDLQYDYQQLFEIL